jgi:hypothetical protein
MMKTKNFFAGILAACMLIFTACDESGEKPQLDVAEIESNELSAISPTSFVLIIEDADEEFQELEWTTTDFGLSIPITYRVQMDVAGNDFADAYDLASTSSLTSTLTVGQINTGLLALELTPEQAADIEFRIASVVNPNVEPVYSNTQTAEVTPYATSFPPIWGMGAALKGWGPWPDNAVELQSSQFKKYETITYFTSGEAFRFFEQLDWGPTSYNYPFFTTVDPLFENAADDDQNLRFIGTTGWFKINVDLAAKTVAMQSVAEPVLFMTGAGVNDWNWNPGVYVKLTYVKPGVFKTTHSFIADGAFRFFAQADWGPTSYNYPFFTSVDAFFVNAADGDSNLKVVGGGSATITVDLNEKAVVKD